MRRRQDLAVWNSGNVESLWQLWRDAERAGERGGGLLSAPSPFADLKAAQRTLHRHPLYVWVRTLDSGAHCSAAPSSRHGMYLLSRNFPMRCRPGLCTSAPIARGITSQTIRPNQASADFMAKSGPSFPSPVLSLPSRLSQSLPSTLRRTLGAANRARCRYCRRRRNRIHDRSGSYRGPGMYDLGASTEKSGG
jgi:hypothetical protein